MSLSSAPARGFTVSGQKLRRRVPLEMIEQLRRQHTMADVQAKSSVTFPLRFVEELVIGRFLWECRMRAVIVIHVLRFISGERGLHVDEPRTDVRTTVCDRRQRRMRL